MASFSRSLAVLTGLLAATCNGYAASDPDCVIISTFHSNITAEFDTKCSTTSILVRAEVPTIFGGGDMKIRSRICLENQNGKWDCGSNYYSGGDTQVYWICNPTGRVIFDAVLVNGAQFSGCLKNYNKEDPIYWKSFSR